MKETPGTERALNGAPAVDVDAPSGSWSLVAVVGLVAAMACSVFVFIQMRPDLLFADTTPAGGDMGAHVWGPAYLRDQLLPAGRLSGWTPDWYAGFSAYHFYMVVPSLAIIAVNTGLTPVLGIVATLVLVGGAFYLTRRAAPAPGSLLGRLARRRTALPVAAAMAGVLLIGLPYGISFKLVSVAGLVSFPLMAWVMARLARAPEPVPPFAALAATIFLFDTNFSILGGNIASTLAGEFAFSISLSLTLLAIGVSARGMASGRARALGAVVIGLVALTHIIPVFFMIVALTALACMASQLPRLWPVAVAIGLSLIPVAMADGTSTSVAGLSLLAVAAVLGALLLTEPEVRARARWLLVAGPVAMSLSAFWLLPFVFREPYFNDMGWERLNEFGPKMLTLPMRIALPVAVIGAVLSLATRERVGMVFTTTGVVAAAAVVNLPAGALWNERLLPFYYLSVYIVAAVGVALVARYAASAITEDYARPSGSTLAMATTAGLIGTIIAIGVPLRVLPFTSVQSDGTHRWLVFTSHDRSFLPSWTAWNYSGYERKPLYREYHGIVTAMDRIGDENGCGRAMWEYDEGLDAYGTPMALMLLPHWTDGCIGSMEGLYFESSATTPFHFLNQSTLSEDPSRAQRDLPYQGFDIASGVDQLQVMGVRYYMARSDTAIAAADASSELTRVGEAQPYVIYEVAEWALVEGLSVEPVVATGPTEEEAGEAATRFDVGWVSQAVRFYNDPEGFDALPAEDGPPGWQRVTSLLPTDGEPVEPATVTEITPGTSSISFRVDTIGKPVLVKASYFPNWRASGADGPWRAGPNLMVVVPTEAEVTLSYGRTWIDWLSSLISLAGAGIVVGLARRDRRFALSGTTAGTPLDGVGGGTGSGPDWFGPDGQTVDHGLDARLAADGDGDTWIHETYADPSDPPVDGTGSFDDHDQPGVPGGETAGEPARLLVRQRIPRASLPNTGGESADAAPAAAPSNRVGRGVGVPPSVLQPPSVPSSSAQPPSVLPPLPEPPSDPPPGQLPLGEGDPRTS